MKINSLCLHYDPLVNNINLMKYCNNSLPIAFSSKIYKHSNELRNNLKEKDDINFNPRTSISYNK